MAASPEYLLTQLLPGTGTAHLAIGDLIEPTSTFRPMWTHA